MAVSIMKTLLTSPKHDSEVRKKYQSYNSTDSDDIGGLKLSSHLLQNYGKLPDKFTSTDLDHCYSKPWNWRPENCFTKPAEYLLVPTNDSSSNSDEEIDVVGDSNVWKPFYDVGKAKMLMDECKKHISLVREDEGDPLWEFKEDKTKWTFQQARLFDRAYRILHLDRLGRLAISYHPNEPMLRRIQVNKTARRFRSLMALIHWEPELTRWIHNILLEKLEKNYLVSYVDVLQTLKSKIPTLIERLIQTTSTKANANALNVLVQRPWDPASLTYPAFNLRKLPGNPVLLLVPGTPGLKPKPSRWCPYLSQLGQLVTVITNNVVNQSKVTLISSLEHMLSSTRLKLAELRKENPARPIYLIGIHSGSALAAQVALLDYVNALVCLGFPLQTVEGNRGQPDDCLSALTTPTLFVIGQHATTASVDDIEEVRERLLSSTETGLVVVGGADDFLRVPKQIQAADGVTQHVIDRCVVEEVGDFLGQAGNRTKEELMKPRIKLLDRKRKSSDCEISWGTGVGISSVGNPSVTPIGSGSGTQLPPSPIQSNIGMGIVHTTPRRGRRPRGSVAGRGSATGRQGRWSAARQNLLQQGGFSQTGQPHVKINTMGGQTRRKYTISGSGGDGIMKKQIDSSHTTSSGSLLLSDINSVVDSDGNSLAADNFNENRNNSLVDQLTPDRLLEMPIIIAADPSPANSLTNEMTTQQAQMKQIVMREASAGRTRGSGIKVISSRPATDQSNSSSGNNAKGTVRCARIILRKKSAPTTSTSQIVSGVDITSENAPKRMLKKLNLPGEQAKTRTFHIPATKHSQNL